MNVLWIEDFGGLKADSATVINLFHRLIPREKFDDEWSPETDLLTDPGELSRFFLAHSSIHRVDLMRHYADFQAAQIDFNTEYDAVVIDINLSSGLPKDAPLPPGHHDANTFHPKAGFYIHHHLIQMGFPAEHICFLTGEVGSTFLDFEKHCHQALMPVPKAYGKDEEGMKGFRAWLKKRRQCKYTVLRRGAIEGCRMMRNNLKPAPEGHAEVTIQFNEFLENAKVTHTAMDDYLSILSSFLPARVPDDAELNRVLRLFARAIAHEWDSNTNPRLGGNSNLTKNHRAFARVMKHTRNWLAHGGNLNYPDVQTAAYLLLINLRAMFQLESKTQRHEYILLAAFGDPVECLNIEKLTPQLAESYKLLNLAFAQAGGDKLAWEFHEVANYLEELSVTGVNYAQLLYQMLWHLLAQQKGNASQAVYQCDCRSPVFNTRADDDFLNSILRHLYKMSFDSPSPKPIAARASP